MAVASVRRADVFEHNAQKFRARMLQRFRNNGERLADIHKFVVGVHISRPLPIGLNFRSVRLVANALLPKCLRHQMDGVAENIHHRTRTRRAFNELNKFFMPLV